MSLLIATLMISTAAGFSMNCPAGTGTFGCCPLPQPPLWQVVGGNNQAVNALGEGTYETNSGCAMKPSVFGGWTYPTTSAACTAVCQSTWGFSGAIFFENSLIPLGGNNLCTCTNGFYCYLGGSGCGERKLNYKTSVWSK